jgi:hypothetical protein
MTMRKQSKSQATPRLSACVKWAAILAPALLAVGSAQHHSGIPAAITTPDRVQTRIGTLDFKDGMPSTETVAKVYDNLDFTHAFNAFVNTYQPAGIKRGNWIQTMPGKGFFPMLRLYSPLEPFFAKTWRPSEVELVQPPNPSTQN